MGKQFVQVRNNPAPILAPIVSSFNERIRPILDAVDKLLNLNIVEEGIKLPTIVVVGDQSSGKSSVLESLVGISRPRGQGICTRVPLLLGARAILGVQQQGNIATEEIAGSGKSISNTPITLMVKKKGVSDFTMVYLPGITRVPDHGQPENIYDQIRC